MATETWIYGAIAALCIGLSKGGIPGIGNLGVALFAMIFPPRESVGIVLPIMIAADMAAVVIYRKETHWDHLKKLFPWTAVGILIGFGILKYLNTNSQHEWADQSIRMIIGSILITVSLLHVWKRWLQARGKELDEERTGHSPLVISSTGVLAGFATMTANAAGPIAQIYFLAARLPKYAFIATSVWFFFFVNLSKVPFMIWAGSLSLSTFKTSLMLLLFAGLGAITAPRLVRYIKQTYFEWLIWLFAIAAGIKLVMY